LIGQSSGSQTCYIIYINCSVLDFGRRARRTTGYRWLLHSSSKVKVGHMRHIADHLWMASSYATAGDKIQSIIPPRPPRPPDAAPRPRPPPPPAYQLHSHHHQQLNCHRL